MVADKYSDAPKILQHSDSNAEGTHSVSDINVITISKRDMNIDYDKEADALYIAFGNAKVAKNKKIDDLTIMDLDKDGQIIGIEFLDASKRIPSTSLAEVNVKKKNQYDEVLHKIQRAKMKELWDNESDEACR